MLVEPEAEAVEDHEQMKIGWVIAAAVAGSMVSSGAAIGVIFARQTTPVWSAGQLGRLAQSHTAVIGLVFVLAFAFLSFAIFVVATNASVVGIKKRLVQTSPPDEVEGVRSLLYSTFTAASLESIARKLDDSFAESRSGQARVYLPFQLSRSIRLEILRIYVQRLTAIEIATVLFFAVYSVWIAQLGQSAEFPNIVALPWPNIVAVLAIVILGAWLWTDDTIDSMTSELSRLWHRLALEKTQSAVASTWPNDSAFLELLNQRLARYSERIEVANETLYQHVAELVLAHQKTIDGLIGSRDGDREDVFLSAVQLQDFSASMNDFIRRVLPELVRLSADQEKLHMAMRKRAGDGAVFDHSWTALQTKLDALEVKLLPPLEHLGADQKLLRAAIEERDRQVGDFNRRWAELVTKIDALEVALARRLATSGPTESSKIAGHDVKGKGSSSSVAKDLEALLTELTKSPS